MTEYRMRNALLFSMLSQAFPGFDRKFEKACIEQMDLPFDFIELEGKTENQPVKKWALQIRKADISVIRDYDPKNWNNYREVRPPKEELMRLEIWRLDGNGGRSPIRYCARHSCGRWVDEKHNPIAIGNDDDVRYRPWEE